METETKILFCLPFYLCVDMYVVCVYMCVCVKYVHSCLWRPEEEPEASGAGVIGSCGQLYLTTESNLQALETWLYGNL